MFRTDASAPALRPMRRTTRCRSCRCRPRGRAESFVTSRGHEPGGDARARRGRSHRATTSMRAVRRALRRAHRRPAERCQRRLPTIPASGFTRLRPADIAVLVRDRHGKPRRSSANCAGAASPRSTCPTRTRCSTAPRRATCCPGCARSPRRAMRGSRARRSPRAASACRSTNWPRWPATTWRSIARSEQLRDLHRVWQEQGVLTMLRQTLHLLQLPARWLGAGEGAPAAAMAA